MAKTTMVKQVVEKVMTEGLFHRVVMAIVLQTVNLKKIQSSICWVLWSLVVFDSDDNLTQNNVGD